MENAPEVVATGMEAITEGITNLFTVVGTCITQVTSQPVLVLFLAVSVVGAGLHVFRTMRGSVQ